MKFSIISMALALVSAALPAAAQDPAPDQAIDSAALRSDAAAVEPSTPIRVYLAHGRLDAEVTGIDDREQFARDV